MFKITCPRSVLALACILVPLIAGGHRALAQSLIFADVLNPGDPEGNSIRMVGTDGTDLHTIIPTGGGVRGIAFDPVGGFVYWCDAEMFVVRRARLNGTAQQDLVTVDVAFPSALRLDLAAGKMYWGDQTNENIRRANLDGSGLETPLAAIPFFRGLGIDHAHGRLYWSTADTSSTGRIVSADLDGNNSQVTVPVGGANFKPGNIALHVAGGKIYWTDAIAQRVRRANLNGSQVEDLYGNPFLGSPKGLVLDLTLGKIYFGVDHYDADSGGFVFGDLHRMDLDGSEQVILVSGLGSINDLALVPTSTCPPDFNHSGGLEVQDIFDFLNAWFAGDPGTDYNHVDGVTVQDIFDFLNGWFAGC